MTVVIKTMFGAEGETALGANKGQEGLLVALGAVLADVHQHLALLSLLCRTLLCSLLAGSPLCNLLLCDPKVIRDSRHLDLCSHNSDDSLTPHTQKKNEERND